MSPANGRPRRPYFLSSSPFRRRSGTATNWGAASSRRGARSASPTSASSGRSSRGSTNAGTTGRSPACRRRRATQRDRPPQRDLPRDHQALLRDEEPRGVQEGAGACEDAPRSEPAPRRDRGVRRRLPSADGLDGAPRAAEVSRGETGGIPNGSSRPPRCSSSPSRTPTPRSPRRSSCSTTKHSPGRPPTRPFSGRSSRSSAPSPASAAPTRRSWTFCASRFPHSPTRCRDSSPTSGALARVSARGALLPAPHRPRRPQGGGEVGLARGGADAGPHLQGAPRR